MAADWGPQSCKRPSGPVRKSLPFKLADKAYVYVRLGTCRELPDRHMAESPPQEQEAVENAEEAAEAAASATSDVVVDDNLSRLPTYARGLLQIRVPLQVTLASQRKNIQEITELGPGSIIKFDKTCDEPLELTVGERPLAHGEVVKVGDKFGLRIGGLATR